ncbi:hypothetical protein [Paenibacillus amylolyticus]|uniref:hypothetical protein n=1 Tax=Paenibacillus amylolyticus TaxID=1451 RepID=UPI003D9945D1
MQDKVKLTKEQAEAVVYVTDNYNGQENPLEYIAGTHAIEPESWDDPHTSPLRYMPLDTLIRALYIGYEVEMTEEEQLFKAYEECPVVNGGRWAQSENIAAFRDGMTTALNIVGKRIWGINE